jgi:hypothetical protein
MAFELMRKLPWIPWGKVQNTGKGVTELFRGSFLLWFQSIWLPKMKIDRNFQPFMRFPVIAVNLWMNKRAITRRQRGSFQSSYFSNRKIPRRFKAFLKLKSLKKVLMALTKIFHNPTSRLRFPRLLLSSVSYQQPRQFQVQVAHYEPWFKVQLLILAQNGDLDRDSRSLSAEWLS